MAQDYLDKLEHLRAVVTHHVYEEEKTWFPELRKIANSTLQSKLTHRYGKEFERYMGEQA